MTGLSACLLVYCTAVATVYLVAYSRRPWWSSHIGRAMWTKAAANEVLLLMATTAVVLGDYPGRDVVRVAGFGLLAVGLTYLTVMALRTPWSAYEKARRRR